MGTLSQHNGLKSDCYSLIEHSAYISKSVLNQYAVNPLYTVAMQNQLKSELAITKQQPLLRLLQWLPLVYILQASHITVHMYPALQLLHTKFLLMKIFYPLCSSCFLLSCTMVQYEHTIKFYWLNKVFTMQAMIYCIYPNKSRAHINTCAWINTGVQHSKVNRCLYKIRKGLI